MEDAQALLRSLFEAAVQAATPANCMSKWVPRRPSGDAVVIGAGKAAAAMAFEIERQWGAPLRGTVVVPRGHEVHCDHISVITAAHPVPDENSIAASKKLLSDVSQLSENDTVLCLLSGGGSALLTLPLPGVTLDDLQHLTQRLLTSGAAIHEINCVRKKLSSIKGGKLALACAPARVVTLIISDVPGNDVAVVASGPTVADTTSVADAIAILDRYGIAIDDSLISAMRAGDAPAATRIDADVRILATSDDALQAAALAAMELDVTPYVLGDLAGDARDLAREHASLALAIAAGNGPLEPPCVILSGGETTLTVSGDGRGGRNGEYALALAIALDGHPGISALACDTDGIDGSGDNAGCFVLPDTLRRAGEMSLDARQCQHSNDSYRFFEKTGALLKTGPTRTNVNDFRAILIR
jgi:hydroxypyruvate reductase